MRIGIVSFEYPPFNRGGIATYASVLSGALADAGCEVHVIANAPSAAAAEPPEEARTGLTVTRLRVLDGAYQPVLDALDPQLRAVASDWGAALLWSSSAADHLAALHAERPFDVAEFPECFAEAHVALRRRRAGRAFQNLPIVVTLHTPIWEHHAFNGLPQRERSLLRRASMEDAALTTADALSSPSRALRDLVFARLGLDPSRTPCPVIPYPLDFAALPASPTPEASPPTIFYAGRLEPRKGVFDLMEAALALMSRHPALRLELAGGDAACGTGSRSTRSELEFRIPEPLRSRIRFHDALPRASLFSRFGAATVTALPAVWDNFPYVCCEAMACGGCVVAGSAGGQAEILEHGRSGLLVPPRSPVELAAAIERLLASAPLRQRLRSGARKRVRDLCSADQVVPRRLELYREASRRLAEQRAATSA